MLNFYDNITVLGIVNIQKLIAEYFFIRRGDMCMDFNDRLKKLRCEKIPVITQKDLANALGITQRKVSFLETGTTEPSLKDIVALCGYFNVSADYLLGLPKNMNYPE